MLAWAIRIIALWGAIGTVGYLLLDEWTNGSAIINAVQEEPATTVAKADNRNSQTFRADPAGHYLIDAAINGATVRFMLDTGASIVALSPKDAEAAGLDPRRLSYSQQAHTANGIARFAPVRIRELRIGQASFRDVDAAVMEKPMTTSLLGMTLLRRLDAYEIRDGKLTLWW